MKLLFFLSLIFFFSNCSKPKTILICGDYKCVNKAEAEQYFEEFDNLTFLPGDGGIDSKGAYWGGSYYSEVGESTSEPNGVRVYGTWTGTHTATGATTYNKWYAVIAFNEDGKAVMFSDWMDGSGMQAQIEAHVATQTE